jgi:hypothetical protein
MNNKNNTQKIELELHSFGFNVVSKDLEIPWLGFLLTSEN